MIPSLIPLHAVRMSPKAKERAAEVLDSGYVTQGPVVEEFEKALKKRIRWPVLSLNSGTSALQLAAHLAEPLWCFISTPMTCMATNTALAATGLPIVWADVNLLTGEIDRHSVEERCEEYGNANAVVAVDWGGYACDYRRLEKTGLTVIRDAAHYGPHNMVGFSVADYTCYSFQAIKHLTTVDGGALACRNPENHDRAKRLRWFGIERGGDRINDDIPEAGWKYHMNDVNAAIGLANLDGLDECFQAHQRNAALLTEMLRDCEHVRIPPWDPGRHHSYWIYTLLAETPEDRDKLMAHCRANGVEAGRVHARNDKHSCFRRFKRDDLPGVDYFDSHQLNIPCGWWLSEGDVEHVAETVKGYKP